MKEERSILDVSALGPLYNKGSILFLSYLSSALLCVDVSSSLRIFFWFCWDCFSKALIFYMRTSRWSGGKNWNRTSSFPAQQNQMSQLFRDFSSSSLCFQHVFQKFHLEPVKLFTKLVLVAWKLLWWLILLWKTFLADLFLLYIHKEVKAQVFWGSFVILSTSFMCQNWSTLLKNYWKSASWGGVSKSTC